jgi:hypothetical protein
MSVKRIPGLRQQDCSNAVRLLLGVPLAKFAIGDLVDQTKGHSGVIVAVFTTNDGELRYAVDSEGAIEFPLETSLVPHQEPKPRHS